MIIWTSTNQFPDGDWFCPSCCCRIYGQSKINKDMEEFTDSSVINCHQCELQYHIGCPRIKGLVPDGHPKGLWFCNRRCEQVSAATPRKDRTFYSDCWIRSTMQQLAEFGHRQQEELLHRQKQLEQSHNHLVENSKT